jgi:hypothetical protein
LKNLKRINSIPNFTEQKICKYLKTNFERLISLYRKMAGLKKLYYILINEFVDIQKV